MMLDLNYVEIILKNGKKSLIDPEDSYYINQWKWYFDLGYAKRKSSKEDAQSRWMHRFILQQHGIDLTHKEVDHINGNRLDNRKSNLRVTVRSQNAKNSSIKKNNSSGYKGVSKNGKRGWMAHITVDRQRIYIGTFGSTEEAAQAYNIAAQQYHGEYAKLNILNEKNIISSDRYCLVCEKKLNRSAKYSYCVQHRHLRPGYRGRKSSPEKPGFQLLE